MKKTRRIVTAAVISVLTLALLAGLTVTALGQTTASAAPAAQTTPNTTTPTAGKGQNKGQGLSQYRDQFKQAFANRLGVDQNKLNSAFSGAVADVADQAVKDGKLTQAQADNIKQRAQNGFQDAPFLGGKGQGKHKGAIVKEGGKELDAAAKALGITTDALKTELKSGKSIADVAKARNVDVAKVKDAMLAQLKSDLDQAVKDGKLTQAQADKVYQNAPARIDNLINRAHTGKKQG